MRISLKKRNSRREQDLNLAHKQRPRTPLRVANVVEEGKVGGPQVRMTRVAEALQGRVQTLIVMPRANSKRFQQLCACRSIPYRVFPLTRVTKEWRVALRYVLFTVSEIVRLARYFRREKVDLVHASGGSWQVKAVIAARIANVPVIWHLNDTFMPSCVLRVFRLLQGFATAFIYSSNRVRSYYGPHISGKRPCVVIPPPVNLEEFDPREYYADYKKSIRLGVDRSVVGAVCNVNPIKGLDTLVRAAGLLAAQGRRLHLMVAGPVFDRQRPYYRRLLEVADEVGVESLEFVGARSDIRPFLMELDVFVCSSVSESWGMSLWEAMAMARPIVSTNVGDISRYVVDGESGFVVPVGDSETMAMRIRELLDDEGLRLRVGTCARQIARETCSIDRVSGATGDFYEKVVNCWRQNEALKSSARRALDE